MTELPVAEYVAALEQRVAELTLQVIRQRVALEQYTRTEPDQEADSNGEDSGTPIREG